MLLLSQTNLNSNFKTAENKARRHKHAGVRSFHYLKKGIAGKYLFSNRFWLFLTFNKIMAKLNEYREKTITVAIEKFAIKAEIEFCIENLNGI